jgi:radical SAM protein with 4Fe4S-binding SPASM domain
MFNLKEVIISITNRCNSRCKMCDIPIEKTEELDTPSWKHIIRDLPSCGAKTLVFSGGEPLLREDLFELLSFAKSVGLNTCITSNGIMIDDSVASKLLQTGINVVNVSVEGPEEVHDLLRGAGNFKKTVLALAALGKHKIETTIATTVSRYTYKNLNSVVELAKEYNVTTVKFQPFSSLFVDDKKRIKEFTISENNLQEMETIIKDVILLSARYGIAVNPEKYLLNIPYYLSGKSTGSNNVCGALLSSCPINSKGEIFPCWVLSGRDNLIGSLKGNSFLSLWGGRRHISIIEKIERKGCPSCMMSCYDGNFGQAGIKHRVIRGLSKLKNRGFRGYLAQLLRKLQKRFKFYFAYRGSLAALTRKFKGIFRRKAISMTKIQEQGTEGVFTEIEIAEQMLKDELKR